MLEGLHQQPLENHPLTNKINLNMNHKVLPSSTKFLASLKPKTRGLVNTPENRSKFASSPIFTTKICSGGRTPIFNTHSVAPLLFLAPSLLLDDASNNPQWVTFHSHRTHVWYIYLLITLCLQTGNLSHSWLIW